MTERDLIDPTPELPDDTPIDRVRFPTRIRNVLAASGLKTVGEVRDVTDETLLSFQDLGHGSIKHLRTTWAFRRGSGTGHLANSRVDFGYLPSPRKLIAQLSHSLGARQTSAAHGDARRAP
jgi:hypothetical protein